jgi:NADH-quinone oxidoreductase subunit F
MSRECRIVSDGASLIDGLNVEEYEGIGGFSGLKKAMSMSSEEVIGEIKRAKLLGRGGAAYPAGLKWEHLYHIDGIPKYIVCNADEGEPGTFKDKLILEKLPLRLIEGMTIAGYVFKALKGFIYIRGEYLREQKIFKDALQNARDKGYLGNDILGSNFSFDIDVVSGAGAYVCGENSALLNSTEGTVGRPRIKPPHLAEVGLFLKPTLVNNVETFANIPLIVNMGGEKFLSLGHPDSGGTKLVCLSGHIKRPGVYELGLGRVSLRELIFDSDFGDGMRGPFSFKFAHLGGQSGPIMASAKLDTPYSYTDLKKAGLALGSGAIVVMDTEVPILDYLMKVTRFFIHESCGKCLPCREGNKSLLKYLTKLKMPNELKREDLVGLKRTITTMTRASFCGLGQTAATALRSAWKAFPEEFEENLDNYVNRDLHLQASEELGKSF